MESCLDHTDALFSARTLRGLRRAAFRAFRSVGFRKMAYIHSSFGNRHAVSIHQIGFPPELVESYPTDVMGGADDPFPSAAMQFAFPVRWTRLPRTQHLPKRYRDFVERLRDMGLSDGVSVHVSGPHGRHGYFALGYDGRGRDVTDRTLARLQLVCQAAHNMVCFLKPEEDHFSARLTQRESEILHWIAQGKSNAVIASILGVSSHTVNTLSKRSFEKLGVNDRVSAVIVALRFGLIR